MNGEEGEEVSSRWCKIDAYKRVWACQARVELEKREEYGSRWLFKRRT